MTKRTKPEFYTVRLEGLNGARGELIKLPCEDIDGHPATAQVKHRRVFNRNSPFCHLVAELEAELLTEFKATFIGPPRPPRPPSSPRPQHPGKGKCRFGPVWSAAIAAGRTREGDSFKVRAHCLHLELISETESVTRPFTYCLAILRAHLRTELGTK